MIDKQEAINSQTPMLVPTKGSNSCNLPLRDIGLVDWFLDQYRSRCWSIATSGTPQVKLVSKPTKREKYGGCEGLDKTKSMNCCMYAAESMLKKPFLFKYLRCQHP